MLQKLAFKPGVDKEQTRYASEGGWWETDKVRFRSGLPEKIGGWIHYSPAQFWGACRSLFAYQCACGAKLTGVGTHLKYYAEFGSAYYDITPLDSTSSLSTNAFTSDTGTPTVLYVNDAAHTPNVGDFFTISGAASFNGVPASEINGEHRIIAVSVSRFAFAITTSPTSNGTGGSCSVAYQLGVGNPVFIPSLGWGSGTWGRGSWGSDSGAAVYAQPRLWASSNYGNAIVFGPCGGGLYYWDFNAGAGLTTRASLIASMSGANHVPTHQSYILVSDQSRFVITLGSNDYGSATVTPMLVRWSDQENYLQWEPMATTQAGSQVLGVGSMLICAKQTRQEILVWSDAGVYSMQYLGPPFVFGFTLMSDNTSIAGPNAAIVVGGTAYWMGTDKFYTYNGAVQPLPSSLRTYVFGDINADQMWQVTCGHIEEFNEIWWHYPSSGSLLNDRYVVYNYAEQIWYHGTMGRQAFYSTSLHAHPIAAVYDAATEKGYLYDHEYGVDDSTTAPATPIQAYIESADFDIGDGHNFGFVSRIIPDITFAASTAPNPYVTMALKPRRFSGSDYGVEAAPSVTRVSVVPIEQYTEQVFVRLRGRQMSFRVASDAVGVKWHLGAPRIDIRADGKR